MHRGEHCEVNSCLMLVCRGEGRQYSEWEALTLQGFTIPPGREGLHDSRRRLHKG